jgi:hypothetical protein
MDRGKVESADGDAAVGAGPALPSPPVSEFLDGDPEPPRGATEAGTGLAAAGSVGVGGTGSTEAGVGETPELVDVGPVGAGVGETPELADVGPVGAGKLGGVGGLSGVGASGVLVGAKGDPVEEESTAGDLGSPANGV